MEKDPSYGLSGGKNKMGANSGLFRNILKNKSAPTGIGADKTISEYLFRRCAGIQTRHLLKTVLPTTQEKHYFSVGKPANREESNRGDNIKANKASDEPMKLTATLLIVFFFTTRSFSQTTRPAEPDKTKPFVLGIIDELHSVQLAENRVLNIYLPEGYTKTDTTRYPVIYLLDGSADEDFIHVVGLVQFNTFSWINQIPKSIVVGITNVDRRRDFTYPTTLEDDQKRFPTAGHSQKFIAFIETELQPFVEKKYRVSSSKTIIGQSLGGLLATEILFKKPYLFDKYIIISPSLWWDNGSLLNQNPNILQKSFLQKTGIYIGVGKEGLAPSKIPHVMEVDANVLADKLRQSLSKHVSVHFDYLPNEDHATITHQAVFNAFRTLYPVSANKN